MQPAYLSRLCGALAVAALLNLTFGTPAAAQIAAGQEEVEIVPADEPRPSPLQLSNTTLSDGTYVKIHYSAPRKRDRVIFGELVPYGELWRTAANEASELTVTGDVTVGGQPLPAGTYALFTIPGEDAWTIILNKELGQEGTESYDQAQDALRVEVPAETMPKQYEAFTIDFEEASGGADMVLMWDRTRVAVPIRTN